ncbi:MAG: hypothetical protein SFV53_06555 [Rickettsiales bacterium]|nr:hypothetical protein [Rickettsiales bacterium]
MFELISLFVATIIFVITTKIFHSKNFYEKILGLYLIFNNFAILILINSINLFEETLDVILLLSFLELALILLLESFFKLK